MEMKRLKIIKHRLADRVAKQQGSNKIMQQMEVNDDDSVDGNNKQALSNKIAPVSAAMYLSTSNIELPKEALGSSAKSQKSVTFAVDPEQGHSSDSEH